ncbi:hypothetical protein BRC60_09580 [Halobacteriales archaeon QH_1_68_42]|nr:MAG: hypothetical protein BRC60_09580 [Halobacteriales archaeon QH_1_68_42]
MQDIDPTGGSSVADALGREFASAVDDAATVEVLLWAVVLATVALDVYTTHLGLAAGLTEGNPLMEHAIGGFGIGALAAAKLLVVVGALAFCRLCPRYSRAVVAGLAVPWVATVLVNAATLATL